MSESPSTLAFDNLYVEIHASREAMGAAAAHAAANAIRLAISRHGEARVILASAPSQSEMLEALIHERIDWRKVILFHMDEYVGLGADHPASFRHFQHEYFVSRTRPKRFHGIRGEARDLADECARYAAILNESPIDVVCLGIGENGHLAFNDPPVADFHDPETVKVVELDEVCRQQQVNDGCFPDLEAVPRHAITLTIPALFGGIRLFGIVPGERKAPAVYASLLGPMDTSCPASILRHHPRAQLYLDEAAAALLPAERNAIVPAGEFEEARAE